jgi:hypothetical protein
VKRIMLAILATYLLAALFSRAFEAAGVGPFRCGCHSDCWCKKPGLTLFRWVLPRRVHHVWTEGEKRAFAEAQVSS